MQGKGMPDPKEKTKYQLFLGSDMFVDERQETAEKPEKLRELSKAHKKWLL